MAAALQEENDDLSFAAQSRPASNRRPAFEPRPVDALESLLATAAVGEPVIAEEEPELLIPQAPRRAQEPRARPAGGRSRRPPGMNIDYSDLIKISSILHLPCFVSLQASPVVLLARAPVKMKRTRALGDLPGLSRRLSAPPRGTPT